MARNLNIVLVNANESEFSQIGESGNIYESGKISSSVNLSCFNMMYMYSCSNLEKLKAPFLHCCLLDLMSPGTAFKTVKEN